VLTVQALAEATRDRLDPELVDRLLTTHAAARPRVEVIVRGVLERLHREYGAQIAELECMLGCRDAARKLVETHGIKSQITSGVVAEGVAKLKTAFPDGYLQLATSICVAARLGTIDTWIRAAMDVGRALELDIDHLVTFVSHGSVAKRLDEPVIFKAELLGFKCDLELDTAQLVTFASNNSVAKRLDQPSVFKAELKSLRDDLGLTTPQLVTLAGHGSVAKRLDEPLVFKAELKSLRDDLGLDTPQLVTLASHNSVAKRLDRPLVFKAELKSLRDEMDLTPAQLVSIAGHDSVAKRTGNALFVTHLKQLMDALGLDRVSGWMCDPLAVRLNASMVASLTKMSSHLTSLGLNGPARTKALFSSVAAMLDKASVLSEMVLAATTKAEAKAVLAPFVGKSPKEKTALARAL
jgi:hypothetical protein